MKPSLKVKRGFAAMNPDARRAICSAGGMALVARRGVKHMARIGAKGGAK